MKYSFLHASDCCVRAHIRRSRNLADRVLVLRDGEVAAFDAPDGLRKLTGVTGPLEEALERLLNPKGAENISQYLESRKK